MPEMYFQRRTSLRNLKTVSYNLSQLPSSGVISSALSTARNASFSTSCAFPLGESEVHNGSSSGSPFGSTTHMRLCPAKTLKRAQQTPPELYSIRRHILSNDKHRKQRPHV